MRMVWLFASLAILGGAALERRSFVAPSDAADYHQRVRAAAGIVPLNAGQWIGADVPVPYDAMDMLQPNVMISRSYQNGGRRVWFQLVQCQDVRTLENHYPPHCYPAIGYSKLSEVIREWKLGGIKVKGTEYQFARVAVDPSTSIVVENFMVLPKEGIVRDMEPLTQAAADLRRRKYGAAEFQILFEPGTNALMRSRIVEEILTPFARVIETTQSLE